MYMLLEGVADRLRFKLEHQYFRSFIFCVRDRDILGDTVGRRSRQAIISIGTSIFPYFHFCVRDRNIFEDTVGRRRLD